MPDVSIERLPLVNQIISGTPRNTVNTFLIDRKSRQYSHKTYEFYECELRLFSEFLDRQGIAALEEITPDDIRKYLLDLSTRRNPGGCNAAYRAIKTFFRWAWDEFELEGRNPITRVQAPKINPQPLPGIALADFQKMIDACKGELAQRNKTILLTLLDSGVRAAELTALNVSDVDLITGAVTVCHGKGNKRRVTYIGKKTLKELRRYLKSRQDLKLSSPLFATETNTRLTKSGLRQLLRRLSVTAGIPEPGAHDFRRAFCLQMLRNGADLVTLARMMGHSGLEVIKRYLYITDNDLALTHAKNSPVDLL